MSPTEYLCVEKRSCGQPRPAGPFVERISTEKIASAALAHDVAINHQDPVQQQATPEQATTSKPPTKPKAIEQEAVQRVRKANLQRVLDMMDKGKLSARRLCLPEGNYLMLRHMEHRVPFNRGRFNLNVEEQFNHELWEHGFLFMSMTGKISYECGLPDVLPLKRGCIGEGRLMRAYLGVDPQGKLVCIKELSLVYQIGTTCYYTGRNRPYYRKFERSAAERAYAYQQVLSEAKYKEFINHPATPRYVLQRSDGRKIYLIEPLARLRLYVPRGEAGEAQPRFEFERYIPNYGLKMPATNFMEPWPGYVDRWVSPLDLVEKCAIVSGDLRPLNDEATIAANHARKQESFEKRYDISLRALASLGKQTPTRRLRLGLEMMEVAARTLASLHRHQVMHNDVREESFMVAADGSGLWLMDFHHSIDLKLQTPWVGDCVPNRFWPHRDNCAPEMFKPYYYRGLRDTHKSGYRRFALSKECVEVNQLTNYADNTVRCHAERLQIEDWLKADIYALGLVVLRTLGGRIPLYTNNSTDAFNRLTEFYIQLKDRLDFERIPVSDARDMDGGYLIEDRLLVEYFSERGMGVAKPSDLEPDFVEEKKRIDEFWEEIEDTDEEMARFLGKMVAFLPENRPSAAEVLDFCLAHPLQLELQQARAWPLPPANERMAVLKEPSLFSCLGPCFEVEWATEKIKELQGYLQAYGEVASPPSCLDGEAYRFEFRLPRAGTAVRQYGDEPPSALVPPASNRQQWVKDIIDANMVKARIMNRYSLFKPVPCDDLAMWRAALVPPLKLGLLKNIQLGVAKAGNGLGNWCVETQQDWGRHLSEFQQKMPSWMNHHKKKIATGATAVALALFFFRWIPGYGLRYLLGGLSNMRLAKPEIGPAAPHTCSKRPAIP